MDERIKNGINYTAGVGAGYAVFKYVPKFLIKKPYEKFYLKQFNKVSESENNILFNSAKRAFEKSKYSSSGITIIDITPENHKEIAETIIDLGHQKDKERAEKLLQKNVERMRKKGKEYKESGAVKTVDKWLKKFTDKMDNKKRKLIREIATGKNACFASDVQKVLVNKDKMGFSTFHEIGHGITWKSGGLKAFNAGFGNGLGLIGIPLILAIGLLKNKKKEGENTKGFWDKTTTFIKNNCGIIAGACLIPTIIDEGLASKNGAKLAKNVLDKNLYKKLTKIQGIAFSSYISSMLILTGMTALAVGLRDKIVENKIVK